MAIQHTDMGIKPLDFFAPSYEDIEIKNKEDYNTKNQEYKGLYKFSGDFDVLDEKSIRYYLMQGDRVKNIKEVFITKDGNDGDKGDSGLTIAIEPGNINLTPDREGKCNDELTVTVNVFAFQNNSEVAVSKVELLNSSSEYIQIEKSESGASRFFVTVKKGFDFGSPSEVSYRLQFVVVTENDTAAETFITLNKVSKGISLGRIEGRPEGSVLTNVRYDTGLDNDGNILETTASKAYAFVGDLVVDVGNFSNPNKADVYRFNGSDWLLVNNDINACYGAFEDIMSVADASVAEVICKRLVAQTALINNLITKFVKVKDGGYIRTGAFINPDGSDNDNPSEGVGLLVKDDIVRIKGTILADQIIAGDKKVVDDFLNKGTNTAHSLEVASYSFDYNTQGYKTYVKVDDNIFYVEERGHTIFTFDINTFEIKTQTHFDTYSGENNALTYIIYALGQNISDDVLTVIVSNDACRCTQDMRKIFAYYGGNDTDTWEAGRYPHILIGRRELGAFNGVEIRGDLNGYVTHQTSLYSGQGLRGIDNTKKKVSDIGKTADDAKEKADNSIQKYVITPGDIDFNNFTEAGFYYTATPISEWPNTPEWAHQPAGTTNSGFSINVQVTGGGWWITQTVRYSSLSHSYTRNGIRYTSTGGYAWTSWQTVANVSDIEGGGYDTVITDSQMIYIKYLADGSAIPEPKPKTDEWVTTTTDLGVGKWTTYDLKSTSNKTDYIVFSCTQYKVNNSNIQCTTPAVNSETFIDSAKGLIKGNLIDADTLFAKTITMKNGGKIETYEFDKSNTGFSLDSTTGKIRCKSGEFGGIINATGLNLDGFTAGNAYILTETKIATLSKNDLYCHFTSIGNGSVNININVSMSSSESGDNWFGLYKNKELLVQTYMSTTGLTRTVDLKEGDVITGRVWTKSVTKVCEADIKVCVNERNNLLKYLINWTNDSW